ncbi:ParA family protein [Kitasatospora sp. RB6PN24]|uniref:ParA family protein n=1 Tax=Kitasatospora humi TaxID=2893891 RepID=UPI001E34BA78|nr:ParA family protein [Kitasatospora humi]MCC9312152.1 ParA family protein [Kitasatospora humi]
MPPEVDREALDRVVVIANGKGGVGKTTVASNMSGLAAADDIKTLLVDVNGQGHVGRELGFRGGELDDGGAALHESVLWGRPLVPVRDVRPNLDVVVGGKKVGDLPGDLALRFPNKPITQSLMLAVALQSIAPDYDLVVIDSPPENPPLVQLCLAAARWLVVPVKSDSGSISDGLGDISTEFELVREFSNPNLAMLGVLLFASGSSATAIQREVRQEVAEVLGSDRFMFESMVRASEAVARQARKRGVLLHELEQAANDNPKFWQLRAGTASRDQVVSPTSASVSEDMAALTREIFSRIAQREAESEMA